MIPRFGNHNSANTSLRRGERPEHRNEHYKYYQSLIKRGMERKKKLIRPTKPFDIRDEVYKDIVQGLPWLVAFVVGLTVLVLFVGIR